MKVVDAPPRAGLEWIRDAIKLFIGQPMAWIFLLFTWMMVTLSIVLIIPVAGLPIAWMLQPALFAGLVIAARDQAAAQPITVAHLFAGFRFNGRALVSLGAIAMLVEILLGFILGPVGIEGVEKARVGDEIDMRILAQAYADFLQSKGWLLYLWFGLVMLTRAVLWFALPLLALNPMSVSHAIRWSFYAFIANFMPLMLFGVAILAILFIAAMPMLLGLIFALPVYAIAHFMSYRKVFSND